MKDMKEPPAWWLFVGLSLLLGGLVALMLLPANAFGF